MISSLSGTAKSGALAMAAFIGFSLPADAQVFWQSPDDTYVSRRVERKRHRVARVKHRREAEPVKVKETSKPQGPVVIAISIEKQQLKIYDENGVFAESPVSTGMRGHSTPMGVFSVIGKEKYHRSNIYSGAPMPYMQRITWSGVAMHAGVLPGYPASHGCIRMPMNFAVRMYGWTRQGARVVITPGELSPVEISHPLLFTRKPDPAPLLADAAKGAVQKDMISTPKSDKASADAAAANAAEGEKIELRPTQTSSSADQVRTADASGAIPQNVADTKSADTEPKKDKDQTRQADGDKPVISASTDAVKPDAGKFDKGSDKNAAAPKPRTGHISAYVSRKEGKLFVRQNFEPLFEVPVEIADRDRPLGTHVFTLRADKDNAQTYRWWVVSLPVRAIAAEPSARRKKGAEPVVARAPGVPPSSPSEALDLVKIPDDAMQKIAAAIAPGGSITISDQGLGDETGLGTDFIVPLR
ncbi:MAG: L,D-transpeptidase [Xanthobacteraceae bacterium]|nr:L,D-transpeptidase [Xanthobacteraceae bacterium]